MKTNQLLIALAIFATLLLSACSEPIVVGSKPAVIGFDTDLSNINLWTGCI